MNLRVNASLFPESSPGEPAREELAEGAVLLRGFAGAQQDELVRAIDGIARDAPFRHMVTPGGFRMSVAMTNCGTLGWVSDRKGYRYDRLDAETGSAWPAMPPAFAELSTRAASEAGFTDFRADACLINRYEPGAKLTLHQDKDEQDYDAPIVSVSLGLPAVFMFGGTKRSDRPKRMKLMSGDVVVWGGPSRLAYHGVAALADGDHPLTSRFRLNLTFRKAGS